MLFAVTFRDDPTRVDVRQQQMAAHLAFLESVQSDVLVAGSLRDGDGPAPIGALWIVEAESEEAVRQLAERDPFWIHRLRASVTIHRWSKAFPERVVAV